MGSFIMFRKQKLMLMLLCLAAILVVCGCTDSKKEMGQPIEFTVVAEEDIPEELKTIIAQKKEGEFRLTYIDGEYLYIAVGYGKQQTGGYSIQIPSVYLTETNIVFESCLLGPEEEMPVNISYPYAVIKMEKREEPVIFN